MRTIAISAFAIIGSLFVVFNLLATSSYTARPPQGADAMGLILPVGFSVVAALSFLIATVVALSGGRLAWIDPRPTIAATLAILVAVGIGAAIVCALVMWSSGKSSFTAPFGIVGAGVAPLLLAVVLVMSRSAAAPGEPLTAPIPRGIAGLLAPIAMLGIAVGIAQSVAALRVAAERNEAGRQEAVAFEEKWAKIRNRTPVEEARANVAEMSPTTPLWAVIGALPETDDAEARAIVIDRAFQVPNLNDELAQTLVSRYARYRHASLEFIKHMDATRRDSKWGALVVQTIDTTATDIVSQPEWFVPDETGNPKPVQFVRIMTESADWFPQQAEISAALGKLKAAIAALPQSAARDSALSALQK